MARAKNTSRAEARKRTRDQQRADIVDDEQLDDQADTPAAPPRRPALFQMPNIREDIKALPGLFRTKRLLWLPFVLVIVGFIVALVIYGTPAELQPWLALYLQFFFIPQGLFVYFIAGFVAPRASWLVGLLVGLLSGVLYGIALVLTLPVDATADIHGSAMSEALSSPLTGAVLGAFAGGFAAWYRNFLRGMQKNGDQRRAEQDAKARAKRRNERQEARKILKGRT